jgi:hypothetical protein
MDFNQHHKKEGKKCLRRIKDFPLGQRAEEQQIQEEKERGLIP